MKKMPVYDLIGIGLGPFNLGLAALCAGLPITSLFMDRAPEFQWHPGMLLDQATLQVPFFADLVTLADPSSRYSFLAYLKDQGALLRFAFTESLYTHRKEYNQYCRWVVSQLCNLRFHHEITSVRYESGSGLYGIEVQDLESRSILSFQARHLVIGTGTDPWIPDCAAGLVDDTIFHSGNYLFKKSQLMSARSITLIGSGQSAAEIFYDLLGNAPAFQGKLSWFTASDRCFSMENSKLCYELSSPAYIDYFFNLPGQRKSEVLSGQENLYKGVNTKLISDIYDLLYDISINGTREMPEIRPCSELKKISKDPVKGLLLNFFHSGLRTQFNHPTHMVILATGYRQSMPAFLESIQERIRFDTEGRYDVSRNYCVDVTGNQIFVQNAELHTHGFNAPDLGLGALRNAAILNAILGKTHFKLDYCPPFQSFGIPAG
jgi:lysine N6-hydroxylase